MPPDHENGELVELVRDRGLEPHVGADRLLQVAELRAAQHDVERSVHRAARTRQQMVDQRPLRGCHLLVGQRLEAIAAELELRGVGGEHGGHGEPDQGAGAGEFGQHDNSSLA